MGHVDLFARRKQRTDSLIVLSRSCFAPPSCSFCHKCSVFSLPALDVFRSFESCPFSGVLGRHEFSYGRHQLSMAYRFRGSEASSLLLTSTSLGRSSGFFTFISALETCAIFMPMRVVEPLSQLFAFIGALFAGREKISYRRKAYMLSVSVGPLPARRWDQKFWVFYETSSHSCCLPYV